MKVDTLEHLVKWSSTVHARLADQLYAAIQNAVDGPAKLFVEYAMAHEYKLAEQIAGLIEESDAKALQTWVYDWLDQPPRSPEAITRIDDQRVDLEALSRSIFATHNEVMGLFQQLKARADVADVEELIDRVLDIEEGHTRQMAQQLNRTQDM